MPDPVDETASKPTGRTGTGVGVSPDAGTADWQRRVVGRSLKTARQRSIDRGASLIEAAARLLARSGGDGFTVQDIADEAGQSLRTLYQYFESKDDLLLALFEEAMLTYERLIREAIGDLEDPLERLAGAIISAATMPGRSHSGIDAGLSSLRLRLGQVQPESVARAQAPVTNLVVGAIADAVASGQVPACEPEQMAFVVTSLNTSYATSHTLGNDLGLALPDPDDLARFCLGGLGADTRVVDGLADRLVFPLGAGAAPSEKPRPRELKLVAGERAFAHLRRPVPS